VEVIGLDDRAQRLTASSPLLGSIPELDSMAVVSVIAMIERGRKCVDLAQQLHAVECAITNAKRALIHDHIDHCLAEGARPTEPVNRAALDEFRQLAKYL